MERPFLIMALVVLVLVGLAILCVTAVYGQDAAALWLPFVACAECPVTPPGPFPITPVPPTATATGTPTVTATATAISTPFPVPSVTVAP